MSFPTISELLVNKRGVLFIFLATASNNDWSVIGSQRVFINDNWKINFIQKFSYFKIQYIIMVSF